MPDFGWNYPPGVTGMEREIQGGGPPCATCGHDYEDHSMTEDTEFCSGSNDNGREECNCGEYIELDEEEYRLRQYERKHNL